MHTRMLALLARRRCVPTAVHAAAVHATRLGSAIDRSTRRLLGVRAQVAIDFPQAAADDELAAAAAAAAAALGGTSSNRISLIKSIAQFCEKHAAANAAAPLDGVLAAAADAVRGKVRFAL